MQVNILDFLQNLAHENLTLLQFREKVQQETDKYAGMRLILSNAEQHKEFTVALLANIDLYLVNLQLVAQKFRYPQLALVKINEQEDPGINPYLLQILKKVNCRH